MIDTFLFDLDGTLLPIDMDEFTSIYFNQMGKTFQDMIDPETLIKFVWTSTDAMINNDGTKFNSEAFFEVFADLVKDNLSIYERRFDEFYDEDYLKTKESSGFSSLMKGAVDMLKEGGFDLIVATNPIFPRKAIDHRIKWAGLNPDDFIHITSYEKCSYCKPNPYFFKEILEETGKNPEDCIMVGNDVQEDLIASQWGIETYLITDHIINRNNEEVNSNHTGKYEDFYRFVKELTGQ